MYGLVLVDVVEDALKCHNCPSPTLFSFCFPTISAIHTLDPELDSTDCTFVLTTELVLTRFCISISETVGARSNQIPLPSACSSA